ncbi:membrane dipeptidase [Steroidobacter sp.]|uniref:membrane dipeptidase n=1 Tax=Steroidobacter sp. TaxID=1978227 RepID=UPI002ED7FD5D
MAGGVMIAWGIVSAAPAEDAALEHAKRVLQQSILIDGHNDLPWALRSNKQAQGDLAAYDLRRTTEGQTDLARLREGRVGAQFWSVYIPSELAGGFARTQLEQIDLARRMIERYPESLQFALTADDVRTAHREGRIASMVGIEGGHAIENSLGALRSYYDLGVRYMTLTHNSHNDWADSATDQPARHHGLTPFGENVVREMNRLGMLVDLSHTSPETMHDALRVSRAPVIFSHSAARALCDVPRNVPDDVLRELPKNGGVVMVTFVAPFINQKVARITAPVMAELIDKARAAKSEEKVERLYKEAFASVRLPPTTIGMVADHIEHIRAVAGIRHIGIGSDFDGNDEWPAGLSSVADFPNLFAELIRRGWSDQDLRLLAGENVLGALQRAEAVAASMRGESATHSSAFVPLPECTSMPHEVRFSREGLFGDTDQLNSLLPDERGSGWRSLFDGRSMRGWRGYDSKQAPAAWRVETGALTLAKLEPSQSRQGRADLITDAAFENFELRLQWKVAPGANGGLFFFVREGAADRIWKTAPELQILDDAHHEDGALPSHRSGGLYDLFPPACNAVRPVGEYNDARLVVNGSHVEHWLNGYLVTRYDLDSAGFQERLEHSKFRDEPTFAKVRRGSIGLQDHGDAVSFRNIRIRELPTAGGR